jgi:hypothetical protein
MLVLAAYPVATLACVLTPGIRSQKGYQALLILTGLFVTTLTLERTKQAFYLIEVIPLWTAVVAAWLCWAWTHHTIPRVLIGLAVCCLLAIQLGRAVQLARKDTFHTEYQPVAQYLLRNTLESETVMGSAIFAFSLGFDRANLIDDLHLGYYSRKQANVVVMDKRYQEYLDHYVERRAPDVSRYIHDLLGKYRVIYEQSSYRIYHR